MEPYEVVALARALYREKEEVYGHASWRQLGLDGCLEAAVRKAVYLKAQKSSGLAGTSKFREDLLDMIIWAAFTYCLTGERSV